MQNTNSLKVRSSKVTLIITVVSIIMILLIITGVVYSYSKNSTLFGMINKDKNAENNDNRVAYINVSVDGNSDTTVDFKAYATTKVSDIKKVNDTYKGNSFVEGAYQVHTLTVKNDSEVSVNCVLDVKKTTNDDRVFYVIIPNMNSDVISSLYTEDTLNTIDDVRSYVNSKNTTSDVVNSGETKTYSMVIWSEHDSVYVDDNNDGVADEVGKKLSELSRGIPTESYTINYSFEQYD